MTTAPQAALLSALAEFNRYFTSANGVDVSARISVPRDEWRALHAAILAKLQATHAEPVQDRIDALYAQIGRAIEDDSLSINVTRLYDYLFGEDIPVSAVIEDGPEPVQAVQSHQI